MKISDVMNIAPRDKLLCAVVINSKGELLRAIFKHNIGEWEELRGCPTQVERFDQHDSLLAIYVK